MNKPFNLEAAIKGEPIVWRGTQYTFCEVRTLGGEKCLYLTTDKNTLYVRLDGTVPCYGGSVEMAPKKVKKTRYANLYPVGWKGNTKTVWFDYATKDEAIRCATEYGTNKTDPGAYALAVPVEITVEE